jgi:hypothetical protein
MAGFGISWSGLRWSPVRAGSTEIAASARVQPSWRRELVFGVRRRPGACWLASSARTSYMAAART